jgi:hypothetical protein
MNWFLTAVKYKIFFTNDALLAAASTIAGIFKQRGLGTE